MTLSNRPNWTMAIGLPLLVIMVCVVVSLVQLFCLHPDAFSTGITLDLTPTAPLVYFLVIRKTAVPKMTTIRVFIPVSFLSDRDPDLGFSCGGGACIFFLSVESCTRSGKREAPGRQGKIFFPVAGWSYRK